MGSATQRARPSKYPAPAERLVHTLAPSNDKQRNAIENAKPMIW
jgi:hypothetical protein